MRSIKMEHAEDPRQTLVNEIGDLSEVKIYNNWILCAVYKRPEKTASGIFLTDGTRKEDEYQGKVGLVVKKGPIAFQDDSNTSFFGQDVEIGDWVVFRPSDGWSLNINGTLCRMLQDTQIRLVVNDPDVVI